MRVAVLVKHKTERKWNSPDVGRVPEWRLQTILSEDPDLIPFDDERRPVVLVSEFTVSFGSVDLVGVSATGSITIGECKKKDNPEVKRTVVGQLLAYASSVWGMSYEQFDGIWQAKSRPPLMTDEQWEKRRMPPLVDCVRDGAEERGLPFEEQSFRLAVADNLRQGRFTLLFAVDEITEELQRIVEYLSGHVAVGVSVIALELGYVSHGDVEVLIPKEFGLEIAQQAAVSARGAGQWDEATFMEALGKKGAWAPIMAADLLRWADDHDLLTWYGEGPTAGTVYLGLNDAAGARRRLIGLWTTGAIEVGFREWMKLPPYDSHDDRAAALGRIDAMEGVSRPERKADSWPSINMQRLHDRETVGQLKDLLVEVVGRIRSERISDGPDDHASGPYG